MAQAEMSSIVTLSPAERIAMAQTLIREQQAKQRATNPAYKKFQRTYRNNPVAFAHDCIDWEEGGPTFYQDDIWDRLQRKRRVCVRGPHGLGKTTLSGVAVLWFALTRDGRDWKIPTTAGAWRQLSMYLWPEVRKWSRKLKWGKIGRNPFDMRTELMQLSLRLTTGAAFAVASNNAALIEGGHADSLLFIFDESKSIDKEIWTAAEGAFSCGEGREAFALACSTPGEPRGVFYDIQSRKKGYEDWDTIKVSKEDAIRAGRMTHAWCDQRARQWGPLSQIYNNRVEGDFCENPDDCIVPLRWVELANERWELWQDRKKPGVVTRIGADIGGGGGVKANRTVLAARYSDTGLDEVTQAIDTLEKYTTSDTMATTGKIVQKLDQYGCEAVVDVVSIGAGVVSRLRELNKPVVAFSAHEKTVLKDKVGRKYYDKRSAAWLSFADKLDPDGDERIALPPDDDLTGELTLPKLVPRSDGRQQVESKEDLKTRMKALGLEGRSTDSADPVIMVFYEERRSGWARGRAA